ncbi:MAG TPA: DUF4214 domain-containing protein [Pirellulales bacterium]|nr:DUF4214 domain-containing protein [Pirellulales bacterium]
MASFPASSGSSFFRRVSKKKAVPSRKRGWKSHRPLLAEALEGRWMLDANVAADPNNVSLSTAPGGTVVLGSSVKMSDMATLTGGSSPTGTITFYLFAPGVTPAADHSNNVYSDKVTVSGDGNYSTSTGTNPGGAMPAKIGTFQWLAVYSGDAHNQSVSSTLGDEPQTVVSPPAISTFEGGTLHLGSGGKLYDSAQLQGGMNPTGTITFYLFAPGVTPNATDGNNIYTDTVTIDPANPYALYDVTKGNNPGGHVPQQTGTYQWVAVYSGDANNPPQASEFGDEPQKVVPSAPTITTVPGPSVVFGSGQPLTDTATLAGGSNPNGTITFYLFAPNVTPAADDSNNIYSDSVTINGNGSYSTASGSNPGGHVPQAIGTYQWVAVYSGDANNASAESNFGDEPEVSTSPPAISTFEGGTLHLGSGGKLYDSAQLQGGINPTGTITFYLFAPGVTPNATDSNNVYTDTVTIDPAHPYALYDVTMGNNPGGPVPTQTGTYQWIAVYSGDANNPPQASQFDDEPQKVVPPGQAQVVVLKIADQQSIDAGQIAGFTIKLLNEGANTATGVTLNDALPPGVAADVNWQIDSSGNGFAAGTNPGDFTITGPVGHQVLTLASSVNALAAGASISVHLTGQTSLNDVDPNLPPCTTTLVNTATVNAANEPANDQNAQASATITLHNVDLDVSKTADQTQVVAGQIAGFTIQIFNQGCLEPQNATLTDQLSAGPGNDIFWRLDPTQGSAEFFQIVGQIGQQQLELLPGANLQPGGLISVHIIGQTTVNDVGTLTNTATVNASNEPSFEDNAQASASIHIEPAQGNAQSLYVQAAFEQVLGRQPDQASLASFVNALDNGMSRTTFAMTLTHSDEYYDDVISRAYQHFLGRSPDSSGLQYWDLQMRAGLTDEQLEAQFIGSPEYYQHSGGTDKAWVDHMYFDLLGRSPDVQGETYWVAALAGGAARSSVALGFAASAEREGDQVKEDYEIFLGRLPTQSEIDGWVTAFEQGLTNEDVIAGFIASDEYFADHS